ncbi:MAG: hypothetical protein OXF74_14535 [Rhodobacteraceae bacterium]|nr:hypothetical protein [Paracoccaceae bacterium]
MTGSSPLHSLHEQTFNIRLADALREVVAAWRDEGMVHPESQRGGPRPDIIIDENGKTMRPVIIECAYGGDNDRDARERLAADEFQNIDTVVALAIPHSFQTMTDTQARASLREPACRLGYAAMQREKGGNFRFPSIGYCQGNVADLAAFVRMTSASRETIERAAESAARRINRAAAILSDRLAQNDVNKVVDRLGQGTKLDALRTASLLWLDAMLVQSHLRNCGFAALASVPNPSPAGNHSIAQLRKAWNSVLAANWNAIFQPAIEVMEISAAGQPGAMTDALSEISAAREKIETARIGDGFNVGGELFPKVSADRKTAAAFYTTAPISELLAALTIRDDDGHDWSDPKLLRTLRVADLACGTGTLLRAAWRRIRSLGESRSWCLDDVANAHTAAMEGGLVAADVSPIAAHLANSGMALAGGGTPYGQTQIGWVEVGQHREFGLSTGSLEFLEGDTVSDALWNEQIAGVLGGDTQIGTISVIDESIDYVIMNPPYSRTRGKQAAFDIAGLSEDDRKLCQKRWGRLLKRGQHAASRTAGMSASFLCLARAKIRPGGRIGFVLPLTAAFARSWAITREMVRRDFEDILAITRAEQVRDEALSADTGMGEMLLIAKRRVRSAQNTPAPVACVSLRRMPTRQGEAAEFARSILAELAEMHGVSRPVMAGGEELGQIVWFQPDGGAPWSPLGSLRDDIALDADRIGSEGILAGDRIGCGMTTIGQLFDVGPTHHLIGHPSDGDKIGAYRWTKSPHGAAAGARLQALWSADAKCQRRIVCDATHRGELWNSEIADRIAHRTGTLHYAKGMRWTSQAVLAVTTDQAVFGGRAWATLLHGDIRICRAFALWANSIFGMLVHWSHASRTQAGRAPVQIKAILAIPCPDFGSAPEELLQLADRRYAELSWLQLLPACFAHQDQNRQKIDLAVLELLELDNKAEADRLRNVWCTEPTVHGNNRRALAELPAADAAPKPNRPETYRK